MKETQAATFAEVKAPELSETAAAIAKGRELLQKADQIALEAGQQAEEAQATVAQADRVLDKAHKLLTDIQSD